MDADRFLNKDEVDNIIKRIILLKESDSEQSYEMIKNMLLSIETPYFKTSVSSGKSFYRARRHLKGDQFFKTIRELSYIGELEKIKMGRANEREQPMFYCGDCFNVSYSESSVITRDRVNPDKEIITMGRWVVKKELRGVINFIVSNYKDHTGKSNKTIEQFYNAFKKDVKQMSVDDQWIKFMRFFSDEFRIRNTNEKIYKTTAAFANSIYGFIGEDYNSNEVLPVAGILYPSAIFPYEGVNLALKPELIDNGSLVLEEAKRYTFEKDREGNYIETECIHSDIDYKTGKIYWKTKSLLRRLLS